MYERDPDGTSDSGIPVDKVVREASHRILDDFVVFFEWIRNSLRQILSDIDKRVKQRNTMHNDAFWRDVIKATLKSTKLETQLWDFKETLTIWHAQGETREKAKVTLAQDVASLANAQGGVLIIGVTDRRQVVGIGSGHELESRLKFARDVLADRLDYPRDILHFQQVSMPDDAGVERACLVIVVARSLEPVGVKDSKGQFTYPVRRETGITRENPRKIHSEKMFYKSRIRQSDGPW
jgi:hypothetical protein